MNKNKTILITGASSGIGRAAAMYFQERGWNVVATMRSPEKETELATKSNVLCTRLDVTDPETITAAIDSGRERFGSIDVLLNNAGYGLVGPFEATSNESIRKQFETNVFGVMNVTRALLPYFRAARSGMIITVSSMGGRLTFPLYSLYHASKWAVEGFMEALSYELQPLNIRVKLVEPGPIRTDFYDRSMDRKEMDSAQAQGDDYAAMIQKTMPRMQQAGATGAVPSVVAAAIFRAATDQSTRLRYPGDPYARAILIMRKLLPDRLFLRAMYWYLVVR